MQLGNEERSVVELREHRKFQAEFKIRCRVDYLSMLRDQKQSFELPSKEDFL